MTVDTIIIKERILNIVTTHHGGVFMPELPMYYNEQYGEALPHNWQKVVEECPEIIQEKGVANKTILCRSIPSSKVIKCILYIFGVQEVYYKGPN